MKKIAMLLMITTIVSKLLGLGREIAISYFYGASSISDAYFVSLVIPTVIFGFIGAGIFTVYIPMYSKIEQNFGTDASNRYTNNLVNILFVVYTVIICFGLIFTENIVKIFALGFSSDTLELAVQFTKISILGIYFTGVLVVYTGFLQLKGNYLAPSLVGIPMNCIIILSVFISTKGNILLLAFGNLVGTASQILILIPSLLNKGYKYKYIFDLHDKHIKNMVYLALPVILGVSFNQINVLVDKTMASQIAIGGISSLNYANKLNTFVLAIFVTSISTAIFPLISRMAVENNIIGLKRVVKDAIVGINILIFPATIGAMIFAKPIVRLFFDRGAFDNQALFLTSEALFYYSIGLVSFGLMEVLGKAFYSLGDTKTPMTNAGIAMVVNIILNIYLSRYFGIGGLALATSISGILSTTLMFISLRKKIGSFGIKNISISSTKILASSLVMGAMAKLAYNSFTIIFSETLSLTFSVIIGAVLYSVMISFANIAEINSILNSLKGKLKWSL